MAETKSLVGKKVNLDQFTKELEKNNHKLRVCDFMNLFYLVMTELEKKHPVVKETMQTLGEPAYTDFICSIVFGLCLRLSCATLSQEAFNKMVDRIATETIELEQEPNDKKDLN